MVKTLLHHGIGMSAIIFRKLFVCWENNYLNSMMSTSLCLVQPLRWPGTSMKVENMMKVLTGGGASRDVFNITSLILTTYMFL